MKTIYSAFAEQVAKQPEALAVMDEEEALTYRELDILAAEIAAVFPKRTDEGEYPGPARVGIVMNHSVKMIASILAVLRQGAAYVPAEPTFPTERKRFMMADCDFGYRYRFSLIPPHTWTIWHTSYIPAAQRANRKG